ncbi:MAG: thioredoxin domain-containing protein [Verrucomicrobiota bacterium]
MPLIAAVGCLLASCLARAADEPKMFRTDLSFDAALKQAAAQKKIAFVDFFTTWCGPCKMLDRTTWQDPKVMSLLQDKTIPLRIDAEQNVALAKRYQIDAYPTLLLLKPDGSVLDRLVGYRDAARFVTEFNDALAGKTALMRAREAVAAAAKGGLEDQVQARYELGRTLAEAGQKAEALKEYLWLFDEGMKNAPGYTGVRGSFLLSSIQELGRDYPPALAVLRDRRDAAKSQLESGGGDFAAAMDFASLNRTLDEERLTLDVFDKLSPDSPGRRLLAPFVFDKLLDARRYADAVAAQPPDQFTNQFEHIVRRLWGDGTQKLNPEALQTARKIYLEKAAQEIEALAGADKLDDARRLLERVRAVDDSESTRTLLREHLSRAGRSRLMPS